MNIEDKVNVEIEVGTLAVLISGLYITYTGISIEAIPTSLFMEVAERVAEYLPNWDYSVMTFEEWIANNLMIYPAMLFSEEELKEYESNAIFIKRQLGNVELIATAEVNVCHSTNTS